MTDTPEIFSLRIVSSDSTDHSLPRYTSRPKSSWFLAAIYAQYTIHMGRLIRADAIVDSAMSLDTREHNGYPNTKHITTCRNKQCIPACNFHGIAALLTHGRCSDNAHKYDKDNSEPQYRKKHIVISLFCWNGKHKHVVLYSHPIPYCKITMLIAIDCSKQIQ
uniref:AlNc14C254G9694 protein n=1 Tax=Albugo laibachii Nc14 TaxID=890382 RepID=F0WTL8_9STRA|nr:AlNc14C254G9694 [Albugo laibachii Nc14]|eukprot:CCA24709.1 AlNc14C254G9694 [Albugo laibachii Nc14]